jgi:hypothetical protein
MIMIACNHNMIDDNDDDMIDYDHNNDDTKDHLVHDPVKIRLKCLNIP